MMRLLTPWRHHEPEPPPLAVQALSQLADATDELRCALQRIADTFPKEHQQ